MTKVLVVAAKRTPQGKFLGALSRFSPVDLALHAGRAAMEGKDPSVIDQTIIGNVLSAGQGMNPARQVAVKIGAPIHAPAFTVNMMCASGMQAAILASQAIRAGHAQVVLCGGTESMSGAPHLLERSRTGLKLGDGRLIDTLLRDGLVDTFSKDHMGLTAERLAGEFAISREQQDRFALQSQGRYAAAAARGVFRDELAPMEELSADEHPRGDVTMEALAKLRPAFLPDGGTVTPANSSGINDGAAMLLLCSEEAAARHQWQPLAEMVDSATVGCDPARMGLGPVHATGQLLARQGIALEDFQRIELNEAFAAQALACFKELGLDSTDERINPCGGAIALGHPIGASGARLMVTLAHAHARGEAERTLATLCVGGGMGAAVLLKQCA